MRPAASSLEEDGVVRVDSIITRQHASELLECVNNSLEDAIQATREHVEFEEQWKRHFGDIKSPANRHDLKLSLEMPPVRAALKALLQVLQPTLAAVLGEDAHLYELAALVSLPGAERQPVHPDTPIVTGKGTQEGATILTVFCALQDIDATMGPTLFLPATHTAEAHAAFFDMENFEAFTAWDEEDEDGDGESKATHALLGAAQLASWPTWRAELRAGDASLFDSRCLHAGDANASRQRRAIFYCSFIRAEHAGSCEGTLLEGLRGKLTLRDLGESL
eukprot:CAMPEP_0172588946 /NCGR_PEP_ID=MMETSP1068-20121228/7769_1 /TAXON_ID=35684 /ORGANISM="Pseudopedinella elastica, Strain CCMP716" /LENGTH=277 /DNA_ID=CAMNT_0013384421 /DNA_START=183 /DNA_END=1017 /DNA_ORIENTATION=-